MSEFLGYWFEGFEKGLENLPESQRMDFLDECGRACSQSFTLNLYRDIREESSDVSNFFSRLAEEIPVIEVIEKRRNKIYEMHYLECLCDLYTEGYMKSPCLCDCSRQSLLYNLKAVMPEKNIEVRVKQSILRGASKCILVITIS